MGEDEVMKGITKILANSPSRGRLATIISDNPTEGQGKIKNVAEVIGDYITFTEKFMQDGGFMRRLGEILNYVHDKGYKTNLD